MSARQKLGPVLLALPWWLACSNADFGSKSSKEKVPEAASTACDADRHYVEKDLDVKIKNDKDAQMLRPATARKLLVKNGFEIVRTNYRFIFPRSLRMFRRLEDFVFRTPLGTQYMVLARKT